MPIEVVVGGVQPGRLGVTEVGAGVHDVHPIAEVHPATLSVLAAHGVLGARERLGGGRSGTAGRASGRWADRGDPAPLPLEHGGGLGRTDHWHT